MSIVNTLKCDSCGTLKGQTNGWFGLNSIVENGAPAVHIFHSSDTAQFKAAQNHLCGLDCMSKRAMQIMSGDGK